MIEYIYLRDNSIFTTQASVIHTDEDSKGLYIIVDKILFYPQGGGQPADQGLFKIGSDVYKVKDVRRSDNQIKHYVSALPEIDITGAIIELEVDPKRRSLNTRYHTAGHLIADVAQVADRGLIATKGHQFPGEAYIEFTGKPDNDIKFLDNIKNGLKKAIADNYQVSIYYEESDKSDGFASYNKYNFSDQQFRLCKIGNFVSVPCGGTHLSQLSEIGEIVIKRCKSKQKITKISYELS